MYNSTQKIFPTLPNAARLTGHLKEMQNDAYGFYLRYHRQYGECLKFKALPLIPFYSFSSPDALQHILIKSRQKYTRGARWRGITGYIGGNGIVSSIGEHWQHQRQRMNPYFHAKRVESYAPILVNNTLALIEHWRSVPEGGELNISDAMMFLGLINVSDALFGYDIRSEAKPFSAVMAECFAYIDRFIVNPFTLPRGIPTQVNRHFNKQIAIADAIAGKIIESAKRNKDDTMMGGLIAAGNSDKELRDEIITLLMAGHDTTATVLAWGWYELARHPETLRQVQNELSSVLKGDPATEEHLNKLPYLRMVFEETLRLYPAVWAMHRLAEEEDEITGYPVKKGGSMALPVYATHRNPDYWEHPDSFYPEHFSKSVTANRPRFAYLPFGAGERVCIGAQLATAEGILILATLLQHLVPVLKTTEAIHPTVAFTLKPKHDIIGIKKSALRNG